MSLSGDEAEVDIETGAKPSMLRRARQTAKPDEEEEVQPQMRRRRAGGGNNAGTAWILMAFVLLVVLAWWGLMTAVMSSNKVEPHRVTPLKNARELIEATDGLHWDSIYAAHAKQIGWVLEDRGQLLNIGFPDGTTKWYPADAVRTAVKGAERKKKHKKHADDEENSEEGEVEDVHKKKRHHFEEEETPEPTVAEKEEELGEQGDQEKHNQGEEVKDEDSHQVHRKKRRHHFEEEVPETPVPTMAQEGESNSDGDENHEGKEEVLETPVPKRRRKRHHKKSEDVAKEDSEEHEKEAEDTPRPRKHRRRRKKHDDDSNEEEAHQDHEGEGHAQDGSSGEGTPAPRKHRRRKHVESEDAKDEEAKDDEEVPKKRKKKKKKHSDSKRGADLLSLDSNIPKHKETCTYPALHPQKWAEKFGWGKKKDFPSCSAGEGFSSIKFREADYAKGDSVDVPLKDENTLTFRVQEGRVVHGNGVDITDAEVKKVGLKVDGEKYSVKVNKGAYRVDVDWDVLEKVRAMMAAYNVQCTIPRPATINFDCSDAAHVLALQELPDNFFKKMQSTLDAEHRQNELKTLFTTDTMKHTLYESEGSEVADLTEPYLVAVCGERRALYLNMPSQGLKPKKENKKKLNILHVMFDSTSLAALIRACPKIVKTLEELNNRDNSPSKVFSFKHLHAVSCCSPGNQIPMYSGRMNGEGTPFVKAEPNQRSENWIWNVASKLGYNTFFTLDNCPDKSSRDFQAWPSVDHRMVAPTCMAGVLLSHKERSCLTHRPIDEYIFEATDQFWKMYPSSPKYAAMQLITPHEETEKMLIELDDPMSALLAKLEKSGDLNNTAVVFFSDHGINFGRYAATHDGEIEKMFPFMHVVLPRWVDQDVISFDALRGNQDALVTPYDMHQMLRELVYYPDRAPPYEVDTDDPPLPKPEQSHIVASMKSLRDFEKVGQKVIPPTRDCAAANIPPEFCTCIGWEEVDNKDNYEHHVQAAIVYHQQALEGLNQCMSAELDSVTGIELQTWPTEYHPKEHPKAKKIWMAPNRDMLRVHYTIKDSDAQFEAILSLVKGQYSTYDVAMATRLDAMQRKCGVTEKKAEILCVCKDD